MSKKSSGYIICSRVKTSSIYKKPYKCSIAPAIPRLRGSAAEGKSSIAPKIPRLASTLNKNTEAKPDGTKTGVAPIIPRPPKTTTTSTNPKIGTKK